MFLAPCSDPGSPLQGRKQGDIYRHNSLVQFLCDGSHQLDGDDWIRCVDGSWSGSVPRCIGKLTRDSIACHHHHHHRHHHHHHQHYHHHYHHHHHHHHHHHLHHRATVDLFMASNAVKVREDGKMQNIPQKI